jgi:hypothetical protein
VRAERAADVDPPGTQVLCFLIPQYVQDDATLARVIDDRASDRLLGELAGKKVGDLLSGGPRGRPRGREPGRHRAGARRDDGAHRQPRVAVVEQDRLIGCVTLPRLLDVLLAARPS